MTRRNKIITGSVIAAIILILIIFIVWLLTRPGGLPSVFTPAEPETGMQIPEGLPSASAGLPVIPASPVKEVKLEANIKAVATTFAERYGSYSSQGNFSNLDSLSSISSLKMRKTLETLKTSKLPVNYTGITTKVLIAEITAYEEAQGLSEIILTTQRVETAGDTANPSSYYQSLNIKLVKEDGLWKVDAAEWGQKR